LLGIHGEALEAYRKLAARHPEREDYRQAVGSEPRALMAEGIKR
jgi:hypothetical protein